MQKKKKKKKKKKKHYYNYTDTNLYTPFKIKYQLTTTPEWIIRGKS